MSSAALATTWANGVVWVSDGQHTQATKPMLCSCRQSECNPCCHHKLKLCKTPCQLQCTEAGYGCTILPRLVSNTAATGPLAAWQYLSMSWPLSLWSLRQVHKICRLLPLSQPQDCLQESTCPWHIVSNCFQHVQAGTLYSSILHINEQQACFSWKRALCSVNMLDKMSTTQCVTHPPVQSSTDVLLVPGVLKPLGHTEQDPPLAAVVAFA
jgi:hypothetical protein